MKNRIKIKENTLKKKSNELENLHDKERGSTI